MKKILSIILILLLATNSYSAQRVRGVDDSGVSERLATEANQGALNENGNQIVTTCIDRFRDEFATFDTTNNWTIVQQGTDHTIGVDGEENGSRYLKIETGATENQETILLSKVKFRMPFQVTTGITTSTRSSLFNYAFEVVEVDDDGDVVTDTSIASAPNCLNARNCASFITPATTSPQYWAYNFRTSGISELTSGSTVFITTTPSGTTPNFIQAGNLTITALSDYTTWQGQNKDDLTTPGFAYKRSGGASDPTKWYAIRIRLKNLATSDARTLRIHTVKVSDVSRLSVDFGLIAGRSDPQSSAPVWITNNPSLSTLAEQQTQSNYISNVLSYLSSVITGSVYMTYSLQGSGVNALGAGWMENNSNNAREKFQTQNIQSYDVNEGTSVYNINKTTDARAFPAAEINQISISGFNFSTDTALLFTFYFWNATTSAYEEFHHYTVGYGSESYIENNHNIKFMPNIYADWNTDDSRYGYFDVTTLGTATTPDHAFWVDIAVSPDANKK